MNKNKIISFRVAYENKQQNLYLWTDEKARKNQFYWCFLTSFRITEKKAMLQWIKIYSDARKKTIHDTFSPILGSC